MSYNPGVRQVFWKTTIVINKSLPQLKTVQEMCSDNLADFFIMVCIHKEGVQ